LEQEAVDLPPATMSLAEALEDIRRRAMAVKADELLRDRKEAWEEKTDEYVDDAIKSVNRQLSQEMWDSRKEMTRLEREKRRLENEAKKKAEELEQARVMAGLQHEFDQVYPAMEGYLTAFTSDGYTQLIGDDFRPTAVLGPVSYGRLVNAGLLNRGQASLRAFWSTIDKGNNDRDLGAFPAHSFSSGHFERHYETVLRIHNFLRRFGPLMVKNEDLAP